MLAEMLSGYKRQLSLLISALPFLYITAGEKEQLSSTSMKVLHMAGFFILHHLDMFNLRPTSHIRPRMAVNVAQCKIVNSPCSSVFVSVCVFNVWPKTTLLLPVWSRDAERMDTPARPFIDMYFLL